MSSPALMRHLKNSKGNAAITAITYTADDENFLVSSTDKTVSLYSSLKKDSRRVIFNYDYPIYDVDVSSKNIFVAVGKSKIASIQEAVIVNGFSDTIVAHQSNIRSVHFSSSGNRFITGSDDKSIKIWRLGQKSFIGSFTGHTNWVRCARFSPSNKLIASCAEDKTVKIFDVVNGNLIHSFKDEKGFGNKIAWHKDGNTIAIAQENGRVKIYDIAQRKLIQYYRIFEGAVKCLDFHPSGNYLLTGDEQGLTKILDLLEGRDIYTIKGHCDAVTAVKFSSDGEYFITGSKDKHVMIFKSNLTTNQNSSNDESLTELSTEDKENSRDEGKLVDMRKSVNYNYLDEADTSEILI